MSEHDTDLQSTTVNEDTTVCTTTPFHPRYRLTRPVSLQYYCWMFELEERKPFVG